MAVDAEITALVQCLQRQRNHVLGAVEGLSDDALRRPVLTSGGAAWDGAAPHAVGGAFVVPPGDDLDCYRHEASLADTVIAASSADADLAW